MKKKNWTVMVIAFFAVCVATFQGFEHLDNILAAQVSEVWNKAYMRQQQETAETQVEDVMSNEERESKVIRNGQSGNNVCTFACNVDWGEEIIPDMLKVFDEKNIKITFFVTGRWANKNPDLLKEMYDKGHEIQSHGYSHAMCSNISKEKLTDEIMKTEKAIIDAICIKPNYFAPPSGDYDSKSVETCEALGYKMVLWSSDTIDWRADSYADVIKNRIMSKPLDGAIILMHPKQETLKALPDLIDKINESGYGIVPLYRMPL